MNAMETWITARRRSTWFGVMTAALVLGIGASCSRREQRSDSFQVVDAAVMRASLVRQELRSACKKLRAADGAQQHRAALMTEADRETREAAAHWSALLETSAGSGPGPYAADVQWSQTAAAIQAGIAEMIERINADDALGAFQACGRNCGRFVAMDEAAGVRLAADALFHFRKTAKPLGESIPSADLTALSATLTELAGLRDSALVWPKIGTTTTTAHEQTVLMNEFAQAVNRFADAVGRGSGLSVAFDHMMQALEEAYDAVL